MDKSPTELWTTELCKVDEERGHERMEQEYEKER